ncbi:DNA-binding CsgD family transcriptional regulator [Streptomyces phaeochromogenes]|jgi:DNA-binding CsgD family transcriptional regulator|uniref:LuxR C-terminal-related transcriptional regulator n=1 Tax=Streptomyces phaeochromogenes TaxID=1923 RepID=UPI00278DF784|nr:LuxR C-terminal-related transcriptional regulator [Streptomyces phaeochromogenes]MDQ0948602.1 DNA-binding CsgD family transcriptional regulator [Streptomyces phaeochromogenes]
MTEQAGAPGQAEGTVPPPARPTADMPHPQLAPLDVEILRWMGQDESIANIGARVGVSRRTILRRIQRLMTILGAVDRRELVAKATQQGLI